MKPWHHLASIFSRLTQYCEAKAGETATGKRICATCRKAIKRDEHWRFAPDGRPRHWNCAAPCKVLPPHLHKIVTKEGPDAA